MVVEGGEVMGRREVVKKSMRASQSSAIDAGQKDYLRQALTHIRSADLLRAEQLLNEALRYNYEDRVITTLLKYVTFWRERFVDLEKKGELQRADWLLAQWIRFEKFAHRIGPVEEQLLGAVRRGIFGDLKQWLMQQSPHEGPDQGYLYTRIARCCKGLGEYEEALNYLRSASRQVDNRAATLAELGDCYALVQEMPRAKLLLREAFFISAKDVDLQVLESEMMQRLVDRLRANKIPDTLLREWLPVYAIIWGVFDLKRELRYNEYVALTQRVYVLEREFSDTQEEKLGAQLINCYMHLVDYYLHVNEMRAKIDEALLKIQSINPKIHSLYIQ